MGCDARIAHGDHTVDDDDCDHPDPNRKARRRVLVPVEVRTRTIVLIGEVDRIPCDLVDCYVGEYEDGDEAGGETVERNNSKAALEEGEAYDLDEGTCGAAEGEGKSYFLWL